MNETYREYNFDGLVGPTHNYSGLSLGNVASMTHRAEVSSPRRAALQGLSKMKALHERGFAQAVLPPQERPAVAWLRRFGFEAPTDHEVITRVAREAPDMLAACSSASSMWTANAATFAPSCDTGDGRVHLTPANLSSKLHRAIEAETTTRVLSAIFSDPNVFQVHRPLAGGAAMSDEGAANHTRFAPAYGDPGLHFFVYGCVARDPAAPAPQKFPARQTRESFEAIARLHRLDPERVILAQQNPMAIDAGVFHNDVIAVGNLDLLLYHEEAFIQTPRVIDSLAARFEKLCGRPLRPLCVRSRAVSLADAVSSYLFNSQLLAGTDGRAILIAPEECRANAHVGEWLESVAGAADSPIGEVVYFNLRESMRNGGGPACLRQRIVLSSDEVDALGARVVFDHELHDELVDWVERHYRDSLRPEDLGDPMLLDESRRALDELCGILRLGSVYSFQRE